MNELEIAIASERAATDQACEAMKDAARQAAAYYNALVAEGFERGFARELLKEWHTTFWQVDPGVSFTPEDE